MKTRIAFSVDEMMKLDEGMQEAIIVRVLDRRGNRMDISLRGDGTFNINTEKRIHIRPVAANSVDIALDQTW